MISRNLFFITAAAALVTQASAQVTGLAAHYKLDETSGTTVIDSSPNGLDGGYVTGYTLGVPGAHAWTATAVEFDETLMGNASIPDGLPLSGMTSDLSVAAWIYPETAGVHNSVMRIFGNVGAAWSCARHATGLTFTTRWIKDYQIDATIPLQQWTHVAFVFDANYDVTFYVDGANIGSVIGNAASSSPTPEWMIGGFSPSVEFWDGVLDDIQVYEGTLSDADVAFLFANPGTTVGGAVGTGYCFGDVGSGTPCPCGNDNDGSVPGSGCANGVFASGAHLTGTGVASLTADTLILATTGLEPSNAGLYFQADNDLSPGNVWGDGLQCAGGTLKRLGVRFSDGTGYSDTTGYAYTISAKAGNVSPGDTKRYQCWYRNIISSPCSSNFNASNGFEVTWLP